MPIAEDWYLFPTAKETSFFIFSIVSMMIESTSGRCEDIENVPCNRPEFLSQKSAFRSSIRKVEIFLNDDLNN